VSIKDLLIVDDDPLVCDSLKEMFLLEGYQSDTALDGDQALAKLQGERFRVILSDIHMPGVNGLELLRELKGRSPDTPVIFITGHGRIDDAVEAIKLGAYDYLTKPLDDLRLKLTLRRALEQVELKNSYQSLQRRFRPWELAENLVFRDRKMGLLLELVHTVADTLATVLISGESGTGKTMLARHIHDQSSRGECPFYQISCGALSATLLESELFGHVRGAFPGAIRDKKGKFEETQEGTLFLDDIDCASPNLQMKILRVLQERVIERVGGGTPIPVDVRLITATHASLKEEVARNNFREDLYYRINVVNLNIPPLRERLSDIEPLMEHFIQRFNQSHRRQIKGMARTALQLCLRYPWPGNVRELENVVERAVLLSPGEFIVPETLPPEIKAAGQPGAPGGRDLSLEEAREQTERQVLLETLERYQWNRQISATALGISRTTLFNKMKRLQLFDPRRQTGSL
jgi:DNA-binding NtrC family response regulator